MCSVGDVGAGTLAKTQVVRKQHCKKNNNKGKKVNNKSPELSSMYLSAYNWGHLQNDGCLFGHKKSTWGGVFGICVRYR